MAGGRIDMILHVLVHRESADALVDAATHVSTVAALVEAVC